MTATDGVCRSGHFGRNTSTTSPSVARSLPVSTGGGCPERLAAAKRSETRSSVSAST
jgi:hypothetical protein